LNFIEDQEIEFLHLGKEGIYQSQNQWNPISEDMVIKALKIMLNRDKYPMIVMCNQGRHRTGLFMNNWLLFILRNQLTGTVIGCFRKLQRWNLTSILEEYRRAAGNKVRILNEQFIELFDTDLVSTPSSSNEKDKKFGTTL
jgi:tyrosine-protein phosphatase OCA1